MRSVVQEGLLLGVVGAVARTARRYRPRPALDGLFKAFGADLPDNGTVLEARTVIVSLAVGILVTVFAGLSPAMRATRVPPIAAMREGVTIPPRAADAAHADPALRDRSDRGARAGRSTRARDRPGTRDRVGRSRGRGCSSGCAAGASAQPRRYRIIPALGRTRSALLVSWRGIIGRLARENSVRQPGRTLVTALALTIGLGLVAFISVLAAGTKATIDQAVSRSFAGNLIIQNTKTAKAGPGSRRSGGQDASTASAR